MQDVQDIRFAAPAPTPVTVCTVETVGQPGIAAAYYWIVAHFPIGAVISRPVLVRDAPNILDAHNYVHISWQSDLRATSYDILVTPTPHLPMEPGPHALALIQGLVATDYLDQGQALAPYNPTGLSLGAPAQAHLYLNNQDFNQPTLQLLMAQLAVTRIVFPDGSTQGSAGGGSGGGGSTGPQGPAGPQGAAGPAGPQGAAGPQGIAGTPGATGATGPQGPSGATGPQGSTCATGPPGASVRILGSVANHASLPATGNAQGDGWITNDTGDLWLWSGTAWTNVGAIVGPVGATGPAGPTGPMGATGPQGPAGPAAGQTPWTQNIDAASFFLNNAGRMGIGTPVASFVALDIVAPSPNNVAIRMRPAAGASSNYNAIQFCDPIGTTLWSLISDNQGNGGKDLTVWPGGSNGPALSLIGVLGGVINRVGVNNPAPTYPLDVNGDINTNGVFRVNGVPISTGGGGSQTPWTSNIDAANFALNNAGAISVNGSINITGQYLVNGVPIGGGGGSQTPWLSDIDGGAHVLSNVTSIRIGESTPQTPIAGLEVEGSTIDPSATVNDPCTFSLWVPGGVQLAMGIDSTGPFCPWIQSRSVGTNVLSLNPMGGNVGVGNRNAQYAFDVTGDVNVTGQYRVNGLPLSTGGGSQTPWTSNIDAANFNLENVQVIFLNGAPASDIVIEAFSQVAGNGAMIWMGNSGSGVATFGVHPVTDPNSESNNTAITATGDMLFYSGGSSPAYMRLNANGTLSIGYLFAPRPNAYPLDVNGKFSANTATQLHLSGTGNDDGGYLTAYSPTGLVLSAAAAYTGSQWIAKSSGYSWVALGAGTIQFQCATGATPGSPLPAGSPAMTIVGQNVGIGNVTGASPAVAFMVNRNANAALATPPIANSTVAIFCNADGLSTRVLIDYYGGTGSGPAVSFRAAGGTAAAPTAVALNQSLGFVNVWGWNGSAYAGSRGSIVFLAAEAWTTSANGVYMQFNVVPTGLQNSYEAMRLDSQGRLGIAGGFTGGHLPPAYSLDVGGDINCTGTYRVNGTPVTISSAADLDAINARIADLQAQITLLRGGLQ